MITIHFHDTLAELLPRKITTGSIVCVNSERKASIKDVIESLGIPHPEVEKITGNGRERDFKYIAESGDCLEVFPISPKSNFLIPSLLRPDPLPAYRFVVDVNVAKLASKLRQLGFDTSYRHDCADKELAAIAGSQRRILLTRDRNLLKRSVVEFGHLVRAFDPQAQLLEVMWLYRLDDKIKPFTRCLLCNGLLSPVAKKDILQFLEPLTIKYYDSFSRCDDCRQIYWSGSHREHMSKTLNGVLAADIVQP